MVNLFLSEPKWDDDAHNSINTDVILPQLNKLSSHIQSLVTRGARSEARLWLCSALSTLSISSRRKVNLFMKLLRSKPRKKQLVSQLLQLMFEKRPKKLGSLLAKRSYQLERFFEGVKSLFIFKVQFFFYNMILRFCFIFICRESKAYTRVVL